MFARLQLYYDSSFRPLPTVARFSASLWFLHFFLLAKRMTSTIDCQRQVRLWVSAAGIPDKHVARWIRLLGMNPDAALTVLIWRKGLSDSGLQNVEQLLLEVNVGPSHRRLSFVDIEEIRPVDVVEERIKRHVLRELEY